MRHSRNILLTTAICGALAAVGLAAAPASAQSVEELTVYGHVSPNGEYRSLSQPVSFADLDLRYKDAQDELRQRIDYTARDLCEQLGESDSSDPVVPSCRQVAVKDGMKQARFAIDEAYAMESYPTNAYQGDYIPPDYDD